MRRALASIAGIVGIAALGRMLSRRKADREQGSAPAPEERQRDESAVVSDAADPAEELRRALASQREPDVPTESGPSDTGESLEERRARVHAKAREAIDAMSDEGGTE